jgi:hypothetical protein
MPKFKPYAGMPAITLTKVALLALLYLLLVFVLPSDKTAMHNYHLTTLGYHTLVFVVVLPSIFLWLAAFYAASRMSQYAAAIKDSAEAPYYHNLARGVTWLAWSLPVSAFVSLGLSSIANQHASFHSIDIIITNYVSLLFPLVAFTIIGKGARELTYKSGYTLDPGKAQKLVLLFVVFGVTYCYLTLKHFSDISLTSTNNPYYLPTWLLFLTLMIPYLYAWLVGFVAAFDISLYSKRVHGVLYRQALSLFRTGLTVVIISSVLVQYIRAIIPRSGKISLGSVLIIILIFYLITLAGYVILSMGANRLRRIEEA